MIGPNRADESYQHIRIVRDRVVHLVDHYAGCDGAQLAVSGLHTLVSHTQPDTFVLPRRLRIRLVAVVIAIA